MSSTKSKIRSFLCIPSREANDTKTSPPRENRQPSTAAPLNNVKPERSGSSTTSGATSKNAQSEQGILDQLKAFNFRNLKTLRDIALSGASGEPIDDKLYLMERIIQLAAGLPLGSRNSETLTKTFLSQLWNDLQHPPKSYLGNDFAFRKADGSNNNIMWPHIGATGQPYARTVKPKRLQPIARPDPGVIFDSVLARKKFTPHPTRISSVLFYVASIIIHDIFHTSHKDFAISETSSYLDLAPLYGSNEEQQHQVRTLKDGKLKADCFSDLRILGFPPGVGTLLIMFNRFHNNVVENLAKIDEDGRFSRILGPLGKSAYQDAQVLYDEALFQTGRLVTTGLYINIILKDYVRTILNLNRAGSPWDLDPRSEEGRALFPESIPEGLGNQVSAEFNLVYRWHSCVSQRDEDWTKQTYERIVGNSSDMTMSDFLRALQTWALSLPTDPQQRPFADFQRTPQGSFLDDDLASIWTASVKDVAGRFGSNHVPTILRDVEILGIIQSRSWNLASLNEFREYFKLKPHETFEDINPDPAVAEQLSRLYGHPDNVEIYPGLIVEAEKKAKEPGSGLCTNFTISRAILSDAVALVRSDRFYTVDYTPKNLTNWGFHAADYDLSIDYGCVFHKLVLNAFPNNFKQNSIYAHYPLVIPDENIKILRTLKQESQYDFEDPKPIPPVVSVSSARSVEAALTNPSIFSSLWNSHATLLSGQPIKDENFSGSLAQLILDEPGLQSSAKDFYTETLTTLLRENQYRVGGFQQVDIIRDVLSLAHLKFITSILPVAASKGYELDGPSSETKLSEILASIFSLSYGQPQPLPQNKKFEEDIKKLAEAGEKHINSTGETTFPAKALNGGQIPSSEILSSYFQHAVGLLSKSNVSAEQIAWTQVLPLMAAMFVIMSRLSAQCVDYFLEDGKAHFLEVCRLAHLSTPEASEVLEHYALEGTRLSSAISIARFVNIATGVQERDSTIQLSPGQTAVFHLSQTDPDVVVGTNIKDFKSDRDLIAYSTKGLGPEFHLIYEVDKIATTILLKLLGQEKDVRKVPGPQGRLRKILDAHGSVMYLNEEESECLVYPRTMKLCWLNKDVES